MIRLRNTRSVRNMNSFLNAFSMKCKYVWRFLYQLLSLRAFIDYRIQTRLVLQFANVFRFKPDDSIVIIILILPNSASKHISFGAR